MSWSKPKGNGFQKRNPREAIAAFWKHWPTISADVASTLPTGTPDHMDTITDRVRAIADGLDWELGPGLHGKAHQLCLSSKGDPALRGLAERWLTAAPEDPMFEFYASRQPHRGGGLVLSIAKSPHDPSSGHEVALDDLVCAVTEDEETETLDLVVFHPIYATVDDEELRAQILFIGLDRLLGEDDVERWIGACDMVSHSPKEAIAFRALPERIADFSKRCTGERWAITSGDLDGTPIVIVWNNAIKRIDHLLHDQHLELRIPLLAPNVQGLPDEDEHETLEAMDEALIEALGTDAVQIGWETSEGVRTIHFHVMEGGPAPTTIAAWQKTYPTYQMAVEVRADPEWEILERWT